MDATTKTCLIAVDFDRDLPLSSCRFRDGAKLPDTLPKKCSPHDWLHTSIESFDPEPYLILQPIRVGVRRLGESLYEADCPDLPFAHTGRSVHDAYRALKTVLTGLFAGELQPDPLPDDSAPPDVSVLAEFIARKPLHDA